MIISASRRTDIPACYPEWFFNRIKAGHVYVRNPVNARQVSRVPLGPEVVDGIVFWTKNPAPMLGRLRELGRYPFYFQFTLTSYQADVEANLPSKNRVIIPAFQKLADMIGPERVIWRYDPILLSEKYTIAYHVEYFDKIARRLKGYTKKCTISFIDYYRHTANNVKGLNLIDITRRDIEQLAQALSEIARGCGMAMDTCAEETDLSRFGVGHARCIDDKLMGKIGGFSLDIEKDKTQRPACGCAKSVDIGMYHTCKNGCRYCYANHSLKMVEKNVRRHDPASPLLAGHIEENDVVTARKASSNRRGQIGLF